MEFINKWIDQTVVMYQHANVSSIDSLPSCRRSGESEVNCLSSDEFKRVLFVCMLNKLMFLLLRYILHFFYIYIVIMILLQYNYI